MLPADEHEISVIGAGPNAGEPQKLGDDSSETDVTSDLST
jgi:hypothetical protein